MIYQRGTRPTIFRLPHKDPDILRNICNAVMEKETIIPDFSSARMDSNMETEPRTLVEKESVVANVDYADAVKHLSPWVRIPFL